ncbi:MAG: hypothetical protein ACE37F_00915 [Nannocystaceae bacterium]|nr:hypothetical protein [bacterium]
MPVELDDSTWPLVTLKISGTPSSEEEEYFTNTSVRFPERRELYVAVIDLREAATPTPRFVRRQAAAQKAHLEELRSYCLGVAFVIRSAMLRGALRAIFHLQELPSPYIVVKTIEEAHSWASSKLARKGLDGDDA